MSFLTDGATAFFVPTVDEGDLGSGSVDLDDTSLNHFVVKIVSFASSLSDTGEHRVTYAAAINDNLRN